MLRPSRCTECYGVGYPASGAIPGALNQHAMRLADQAVRLEVFDNHLSRPSWFGVEVQNLNNVGSGQARSTEGAKFHREVTGADTIVGVAVGNRWKRSGRRATDATEKSSDLRCRCV